MRKKGENNCKCEVCGKEFHRKQSLIREHIYCSMICRNKVFKKYNFDTNEITNEVDCLLLNYEIKKEGVVINKRTGKEVKFCKNNKGYEVSRLHTPLATNKDGRKAYKLHRLICMIHLEDYNCKLQVNHKDGNKSNNNITNLEMVTAKQNVRHYFDVLGGNNDHIIRDSKGRFLGSGSTGVAAVKNNFNFIGIE